MWRLILHSSTLEQLKSTRFHQLKLLRKWQPVSGNNWSTIAKIDWVILQMIKICRTTIVLCRKQTFSTLIKLPERFKMTFTFETVPMASCTILKPTFSHVEFCVLLACTALHWHFLLCIGWPKRQFAQHNIIFSQRQTVIKLRQIISNIIKRWMLKIWSFQH